MHQNFHLYFILPLLLILLASLSYYAPSQSEQVKVISTYPATVCPAVGNKVASVASLSNSKIQRRLINGISKTLNAGKKSLIVLNNDALLVEGNPGTALTFVNSGWKSVVPCSVSNGEQWFAGGSGALTSKSFLYIVNSGFSDSSVELQIYTPNGLIEPKSVVISQNSTKKISVDTLVPGEDKIVIGVKTLSGRVSSYLLDERKKGLKSLGADCIEKKMEKKHLDKISSLLKKSEVKNIKPDSFKRYGSARKLYNFNIDNVSSY